MNFFPNVSRDILLQFSQRLGAVALLATLAAWAMLFATKDPSIPVAIVVAAANIGLCSAWIARLLTPAATPSRREAKGIALFNLVLLVLALHLMLFTRVGAIRSAAAQFFKPSPAPEVSR